MESQSQNHEFRIKPENFHPCEGDIPAPFDDKGSD